MLTGKTNEERIWNYLTAAGMNACGAAGLMGNLYAESGLIPTNLQNTYEKKLGYTDAAYTAAVDSGAYTNFAKDGAGYGLAQWTHPDRKPKLLAFAKEAGKSVGDLETQLAFLVHELGNSFPAVLSALKTAKTVRAASDVVLLKFERPANQGEAVKQKRAQYGQTYYDKYATGQKPEKGSGNMGYSNSPLVSCTRISPNRNSPRNHAIDRISIHCVVGQCTVERIGEIFAPASRKASSNYGVGLDGRVGLYVEERDRSWCTSSVANDNRAVTIEVASDTAHPYAVTAKAFCVNIPQKRRRGYFTMSSEKGRTFTHLQWKDRLRIEKMLKEKKSKSEIARTLRVDYTTIMREIKRGLTVQRDTNLVDREVYCAETAERKYQENLRAKGPEIKLGNDHELANYIEGKIADDGYSPEAALHKIKEDGLTFSVTLSKWTVYKYINDGVFMRVTNKSLPMGGRRKTEYKKVQAARAPKGDSIEDRPKEIEKREEPFHWEMDSVLSAKEGGSKKRFLTMTERTSRADLMFLIPDGTMASVVAVLDMLEKKLGSFNFRRIFQTITVDNGSEFQDWEGMTRAVEGEGDRTHIYYCHPYSAFERGSNENGNRMIRRRVPKGTDFTEITEEDTLQVQRWVNEYPRGILGGRSAGRVLMELALEAGIEGVELLL